MRQQASHEARFIMQHHKHIQAVHVHQNETQILFGDEMFVSFGLDGEFIAAGIGDGDSPRVRIAITDGESRGDFAKRATDDAGNLGAYSPADLLERIAYCEPILEQSWIAPKREAKFGPRAV